MGMKLKSGADLCGFELRNFCIQGEASIPDAPAVGRKYFHTGTGDDATTNIALQYRERIYTGSAWKATAYLDDIAAINEKLNLITGDTDTDTLINNLKDLEEFLKDFSETDKLKSLLDGKLSTSGGTIEGTNTSPLIINTSATTEVGLRFNMNEKSVAWVGYTPNTGTYLYSYGTGSGTHKLGLSDAGVGFLDSNTLIHSGNIGSYAIKVDASKSESTASADAGNIVGYGNDVYDSWKTSGPVLSFGNFGYLAQFQKKYNSEALYFRSNTNGTKSDWKTIAFTEFANAQELEWKDTSGTARNVLFLDGYNDLILGRETSIAGYRTRIQGNSVELRYSTNQSVGLLLNSSGNVTIGASDLAGTNAKLQVEGKIFSSITTATDNYAQISNATNTLRMGVLNSGRAFIHSVGNYHLSLGTNDTERIRITDGGNVGIGTTDPKKKLHVVGDLYVDGNIIADGEVSAGGAGAEESTSGSGSAEGVSEIFTPTSTSMAFDHNLGEDVIVQVYEKSGNVWNMVIVDTEITSATRVTLRFGKTETTQHKVVIMGV